MPRIDRQTWANGLFVALTVLSLAAALALWGIVRFGLLVRFESGFGAGMMLMIAGLFVGFPFLRRATRWLRPIFGIVAWDARAAAKSGLSTDDYEKSITSEKMLRTLKSVDRFGWGIAAVMVAAAVLTTWADVDRDGSAAWTGLLVGLGTTLALLTTEVLLLLATSWIRRWALGPELVGRVPLHPEPNTP